MNGDDLTSEIFIVIVQSRSGRTVPWSTIHDICHLSLGRILSKCTEEIAQCLSRDSTRSFLVEKRECLLVF